MLALDGLELVDRAVAKVAVEGARAAGQEFADAYLAASAAEVGADVIAAFNVAYFKRSGMELHRF